MYLSVPQVSHQRILCLFKYILVVLHEIVSKQIKYDCYCEYVIKPCYVHPFKQFGPSVIVFIKILDQAEKVLLSTQYSDHRCNVGIGR